MSLSSEVDALVARFMREFEIPGSAIAITRPDGLEIVRGYDKRALADVAAVDEHTRFAVGSNSKAFLAACLAMLVDQGRLQWEDPVVEHLPEFQMYDASMTREMTVLDLLVHRSGLPPGALDLMLFPRTDHTAQEIMGALRYFRPVARFRTRYAYDNIFYIVAGLLLERVSGRSWDRFVAERVFSPLEMRDALASSAVVPATANQAGRHARLGPPARGFGTLEAIDAEDSPVLGPAGGVMASAADVVAWLRVQLARGTAPNGASLWTKARAEEMWTPHTITLSGPGPTAEAPERPVIQGYALGWGVQDYRGHRMLTHAGGVAGQVSRIALMPEKGIGVFVAFNTEDSQPLSALRYALLDHLLGAPAFDWVAATHAELSRTRDKILRVAPESDFQTPEGAPTLPLAAYAGVYCDAWYGNVIVTLQGQALFIDFRRTPAFKSALEPFGIDAFRTRFGRGIEDAVVQFAVQDGAVKGATLRALSPLADPSFDFHDLALVPECDITPAVGADHAGKH